MRTEEEIRRCLKLADTFCNVAHANKTPCGEFHLWGLVLRWVLGEVEDPASLKDVDRIAHEFSLLGREAAINPSDFWSEFHDPEILEDDDDNFDVDDEEFERHG